jgi:hypothetical protein
VILKCESIHYSLVSEKVLLYRRHGTSRAGSHLFEVTNLTQSRARYNHLNLQLRHCLLKHITLCSIVRRMRIRVGATPLRRRTRTNSNFRRLLSSPRGASVRSPLSACLFSHRDPVYPSDCFPGPGPSFTGLAGPGRPASGRLLNLRSLFVLKPQAAAA